MMDWLGIALLASSLFGYGFFLGWWARGRRCDGIVNVVDAFEAVRDAEERWKRTPWTDPSTFGRNRGETE